MAAAVARMRWATRIATPWKVRPAVGFQVEPAFEGVVDRFDQLADRFEQRLAVAGGLVLSRWPKQDDQPAGQVSLPLAGGGGFVGGEGEGRAGRRRARARRRAWRPALPARRSSGRPAPIGSASRPGW